MEEGGTGRFAGHARSRAQEVLEQILSSKDARALVGMSQKTYSDQPILRTGADFARERAQRRKEGRDAARIAREQRVERRHQQPPAAAIRQTGEAGSVATASSWPSFSFVMPGLDAREDSDPANSELPPALQELRRLEGDGLRLERDTKNRFDHWAIRVLDARGRRLGFLPADNNEIIARLMDGGKRIVGEVLSVEDVSGWARIGMAVWLDD